MFSWLGLFVALYASCNIIASITGINLNYFIMIFIILFFINEFKIVPLKLKKNNFILIILFFGLLIYSILTLLLFINISSLSSFIEMILITMFFLIGKNFKSIDYKIFFSTIIFLSVIQSIFLIIDRSYVFNNLENYLLVTLILGVTNSIIFAKIFENQQVFTRIIWILLYLLEVFAILNMQARGTALFVFIFSLIYPFFQLKGRNLITYLFFFIFLFTLIINYVLEIYENSILFTRMNDLFSNFGNEPRFETYGIYFNAMKEMWFSGFGIGQSSYGIYRVLNDYPHNFILEFGSEFGIIGFVFIIIFIIYTIFKKKYYNNEENYYNMSMIFFIYMFFIFFKSFGIYDSYLLFLSFGFMWSFNKDSFYTKKGDNLVK